MKVIGPLTRPRVLWYGLAGIALACTGEPTTPQAPAGPAFSQVAIDDPARLLTVGVDAPANLSLVGTVAGIVVLVDNAVVDLSAATVDCSGQTGAAPKIGVWIKNNRTHAYVKGGGTGLIRNCDIGVLIGPADPGSAEQGGSKNHVAGLEIHATQAIVLTNSHDNIIDRNRVPLTDYAIIITGLDSSASASGKNQINDNTIATGRYSIYVTSDGNTIWGNVAAGMSFAAIAVMRDGNVITGNQTTALEEEDPPDVGVLLLRGAEGNTVTNNRLRAWTVGIEVEADAVHNLIRGNTATAENDLIGRDAVDHNGDCVHNRWERNTFRSSDPPCIVGLTLDAVTFTSSTTIPLEGPGATFTATFTNPSIRLTGIAIRTWVEQGPPSFQFGAHRLAGWSWASCDATPGVLPRGTCTQAGLVAVVTNTASGRGTLAVGGARATVELVHVVDQDTIVLDTRAVPLTLTPPASGSYWALLAPMPTARQFLAAGVAGGSLYAVGDGPTRDKLEAYDPATNSWTTRAMMPTPRSALAAGVVNGILYAVGGYGSSGPTGAVEAYDPATNSWTTRAPMPTPRYRLAVAVIDGFLYAVGGTNNAGYVTALEAYDPASNTWVTRAPMPTPRHGLAAGAITGILYAVGGFDNSGPVAVVEAYDPATDSWTAVASMPTGRETMAVGVGGGILYAMGGFSRQGLAGEVEAYDPGTNSWRSMLPMPTPRGYLAAGVINGVIYTVGGFGCHETGCVATADLEAFHP